jgi:hypothetical protein
MYTGELAWKATGHRLLGTCYLGRKDRLENYGYNTKKRYWETFYLNRTIKTLGPTTCRGASKLSLADNIISERGLGNCLFVKGI